MIRSTSIGAVLAAIFLVALLLVSIEVSGYVESFGENRGLLQFVIVLPVVSLAAGWLFVYLRMFTSKQMRWALVPLAVITVLGLWLFGPGLDGWPWAVAIGAVVFVPWIVGATASAAMRRNKDSRLHVGNEPGEA